MSAKPIREFDGKQLLSFFLPQQNVDTSTLKHQTSNMCSIKFDTALLSSETTPVSSPNLSKNKKKNNLSKFSNHVSDVLNQVEQQNPWLQSTKLVCKPDQLIKRRGKNGLLGINLSWENVKEWIKERAGKNIKIDKTSGYLHTFLVEPFVPHPQDTEYYVCIHSIREGDEILFTHEGGVDVGDVDAKAHRLLIEVDQKFPPISTVSSVLLKDISESKRATLYEFLARLYSVYSELQFTYLEINPLVVIDGKNSENPQVYYLDLAAKLDQTAEFECGKKWSAGRQAAYAKMGSNSTWGPPMEFPAPFGREMTKEESYISELDSKTGASLKLTILNPTGRIWTMVAGGGASVVYTDAIAAYGFAHEIANYGEYSGAPSESQTYEYAKTILDLMTRGAVHPEGKVLFIGGGIANFTNVAATFKGIIKALTDFQKLINAHKVRIFVRRAGPNYQEGLRLIRDVAESLSLDMQVFGPEMFVTGIVPLALAGDSKGIDMVESKSNQSRGNSLMDLSSPNSTPSVSNNAQNKNAKDQSPVSTVSRPITSPTSPNLSTDTFHNETRSFIYGMQPRAIQGMLDFDYMCKRNRPSVAAMIYPFGGHHVQKFYWGTKETLLPVYTTVEEACKRFPDVNVVCNFASFRSVYESTMVCFQ
ncbi:citrate synthase [Lobulomyces angularis]|nr:citrate synthase [Lobulomyces angularis]